MYTGCSIHRKGGQRQGVIPQYFRKKHERFTFAFDFVDAKLLLANTLAGTTKGQRCEHNSENDLTRFCAKAADYTTAKNMPKLHVKC